MYASDPVCMIPECGKRATRVATETALDEAGKPGESIFLGFVCEEHRDGERAKA